VQIPLLKKDKLPLTSRLTKQRQVIMDALTQAQRHMSAKELYDMVKKRIPRISFATVYRNLKFLTDNNYVSMLESARLGTFYEVTKSEHNHFICDRCHGVFDMFDKGLVKVGLPMKTDDGHRVLSYCFTTRGICKKCNRTRGKVKKYVKRIVKAKI